ncbi:hypothetical protein [Hanstruepera marina]|uniref:hypothetical protein n=1 Tax=Hanstruepera marina TaxID=2873265 RepID=UPI001CA7A39F|nr:hypothetical protein [Hanstruepera marina]
MVTIVDYKTYQRDDDGTEFHALVVQGGVEAVRSKETDRMYFTARTATVPCTFNKVTCKQLLGTEMPGIIKRVETDPYEYVIPQTGELVTLSHRNEYVSEENEIVHKNVVEKDLVA